MVDSYKQVTHGRVHDPSSFPPANDAENFILSSPAVSHYGSEGFSAERPRKPPTITPRRFTRFFTPRSLSSSCKSESKSGRQLRDITKNGVNNGKCFLHSQFADEYHDEPDESQSGSRKRRCQSIDISSSPPQSSPIKKGYNNTCDDLIIDASLTVATIPTNESACLNYNHDSLKRAPRIQRLERDGHMVRLLQRSFGENISAFKSIRHADHCTEWRDACGSYVSTPADRHGFSGATLPFCVTKCNTNSLIAVGQEEGGVRLIDSHSKGDFGAPHVQFRPHFNAVMDLSFNRNDYLLATASGDQTARIVDMSSQKTICVLSGHTSSVKQIRWQPHTDDVLTTSSRDGTVMVWDMRCTGRTPVQSLRPDADCAKNDNQPSELPIRYSAGVLKVGLAHRTPGSAAVAKTGKFLNSEDTNVSITAFQHLSNGREHLLVTASEVNASIKMWDLRRAGRCQTHIPVSTIPAPPEHFQTRNYGVNSMVLSTDGARIYTLCRDAAVYVYSTNHLILGASTEMRTPPSKYRPGSVPHNGLGPLYSLANKELRTGSFYVKASLRHTHGDKDEMLAVGSSNGCAILFPTDERHILMSGNTTRREFEASPPVVSRIPARLSSGHDDTLPRYEIGSALVRGHSKEVTSLCWTYDGDLVTIGDDLKARCWRENRTRAAQMRACGEGGGARWGHGWAALPTQDEDDSE